MNRLARLASRLAFAFVASVAAVAAPALADTITLKDGTKIDGTIVREGESFVYVEVTIGGVKTTRLVLRSDIRSIEKDGEAAPVEEPSGAPTAPPPAPGSGSKPAPKEAAIPDNATRVAFISLEEMVGPYMYAGALERSLELVEDDKPDVIVLMFNSGGGALAEIQELSDVIEEQIKPKYRVVAWIESAISAASMTAITCEEIYFRSRGNFGGSVGFRQTGPGRTERVAGEQLEQVFRMMERISRRGGHDPLIMRAMQSPIDLSCDIDPVTGAVTWRNDLKGQFIVNSETGGATNILTLNALDAVKYRFARGIADDKDTLAKLMGLGEWVEVGQDGDKHQVEFRENVKRAEVKANELNQKMTIAISAGQFSRALSFLGELRSWVRRAPSLEKYYDLTPERMRQIEEEIRKMQREAADRGGRR